MQQNLKNSNGGLQKEAFSALINYLPDNIYFKDRDSKFMIINRACAVHLGLADPEEAVGKTDFDFFEEPHASAARRDEEEILRTGCAIIGKEEYETRPGVPPQWVSTTKVPLFDADGNIVGTFGVSRIITERKQAEQELVQREEYLRKQHARLEDLVNARTEELNQINARLQKEVNERRSAEKSLKMSEERYRRLLAVTPTYIYTVNLQNGVPVSTDHGPGSVMVTGYTQEDYRRNPDLWITMVHPEDREKVRLFVAEDITKRSRHSMIEHRIIDKNGNLKWVRNTIAHYYDASGQAVKYDGLVEDITERKQSEVVLRETEREQAVNALASGVAHSFNNIISIISTNAASITDRLGKGTTCYNNAVSILDGTRHALNLTKRLLAVAKVPGKSQPPSIKAISLEDVVEDAMEIVVASLTERDIKISVLDKEQMPYVMANTGQLIDVLVNLFMNAAEAMPTGGEIKIIVSLRRIERPFHKWNPNARAGTYAVLRVIDNGVGMSSETTKRVFDPFFTTKNEMSSFGLGLTVAKDMVNDLGGWIMVGSTPGKGSTFRVFIPLADASEIVGKAMAPAGFQGKILLVDADDELVGAVSNLLAGRGYGVLTARSLKEAIGVYKDNLADISFSVVNLVLADPDWRHNLAQMMELKPKCGILITSGFSKDFVRHSLQIGAFEFLQKPYNPDQMFAQLKSMFTHR